MSVNILMPAFSPTMEEGTLSKWLVKEGDKVESVDLITLPAMLIEPAVKSVIPAIVVDVAPKLIDVEPTVTAELERLELPILDNVFEAPEIVLFVSVSVVALPTNVSVDVGKVIVPVFDIDDITGVVKVLFVSV